VTGRRDRLPAIPQEELTAEQRVAVGELEASRRGGVIGPFIPALRSPELTRRLQRVGEYLRYDAALPPKLREMAILLTAPEWRQGFEWHVHAPIAAQAGLHADVIAAIAEGRTPSPMDQGESLVYDFFAQLNRDHAVSDTTYAAAVAELGEKGVVDLVGVIGYYTTLAMLMNVAQTEA
jgi:4-carboxymuconolactone decarboxylase